MIPSQSDRIGLENSKKASKGDLHREVCSMDHCRFGSGYLVEWRFIGRPPMAGRPVAGDFLFIIHVASCFRDFISVIPNPHCTGLISIYVFNRINL